MLDELLGVVQGTQTRSFVYDSLKRLTQATNPESGTASYTYDGVGNLLTRTDNRGIQTSYSYDALNRLSQRSYQNDPVGNMWVDPARTTGIPPAGNTPTSNVYNGNNQISGSSYDLAGNQLVVNGDTMTYDAENRQIQVNETPSMGGGQLNYGYDGDGQRVMKIVAGGPSTVYVYDAFGLLAAEYSSGTAQLAPCETCYLTYDHLGSVRMVTDENANVVARHDYLPFGEEIPGGSVGRRAQFGAADSVSQHFTGKERDSETGLDFFGARYYGSALGRFTSLDLPRVDQDPSAPQSWNLYGYVRNNPLANVDPNGMDCITFDNGSQGLDPDHPEGGCGSLDQNGNDSQPQQVNVNSNGNVTWGGDDSLSPFATAVLGGVYQRGGFITKPGFWAGYAGASIVGGGAVAGGLALTASGAGLITIAGASPLLLQPDLGNKLNYLFGLATGSGYNIQRSTAMLSELQQVGLNDTEEVREVVTQNLAQALNNPSSVIAQTGGRTVRESLLMGPNGMVKLQSIWEGTKLITIKVFGGK